MFGNVLVPYHVCRESFETHLPVAWTIRPCIFTTSVAVSETLCDASARLEKSHESLAPGHCTPTCLGAEWT